MIKIENVRIAGWEPAIRGMRNPMNSWDKSDSEFGISVNKLCGYTIQNKVGPNDVGLMHKLSSGGSVHAKYRRMIVVYLDITAPLYWWKEFDTYKVGTVTNSCSTMHKIHEKEFTMDDFSWEHLWEGLDEDCPLGVFRHIVKILNESRSKYIETGDKDYWWQMIQLLPSSYNQRRTVMLNYEVLDNIRHHRANHKLDEWREFCAWIDTLPYINDICPREE